MSPESCSVVGGQDQRRGEFDPMFCEGLGRPYRARGVRAAHAVDRQARRDCRRLRDFQTSTDINGIETARRNRQRTNTSNVGCSLGDASYVKPTFIGGEVQQAPLKKDMIGPDYRSLMAVCLNGLPLENRRMGAAARHVQQGRVRAVCPGTNAESSISSRLHLTTSI